MNVLVYNGPEVARPSVAAALDTLRALLLPHYSVQPIQPHALHAQPWSPSCALLVLPHLARPFSLPPLAYTHIQDYVEGGGALLAFGAGATCSTRGIVTGMENLSLGAQGSLRFFDRFNNTYIYPTLGPPPSATASPQTQLRKLRTLDEDVVQTMSKFAPAQFVGFEGERGIKILGRYIGGSSSDSGDIAGLGCDIGGGRIALWSPNLEYNLIQEPASGLFSATSDDDTPQLDKGRRKLLKRTVLYLGLQLPTTEKQFSEADDVEAPPIARPFPQFLVSMPSKPDIVSRIVDALCGSFERAIDNDDAFKVLKDASDTFHFHESTHIHTTHLLQESRALSTTPSDPSTWQPKHIIINRNGTLPVRDDAGTLFDLELFFKSLLSARRSRRESEAGMPWSIGDALFFSPVVTSTQTLLDKNPTLLSTLPTPFLSIASHQLAGRGRGSNIWLSPSGCLQFSVHLRVTNSQVPGSKLVFVQYLFALAVCEGVRDERVLGCGDDEGTAEGRREGEGWRVRLKWPNDIYALVGQRGVEEKRKIGGILVSTSFSGGSIDIVIGCGINILNSPPITSLSHLLRNTKSGNERRTNLSLERTAAIILTRFESMWEQFIAARGNFEPFLRDYLTRWLHSDQLVTLTTTAPPTQVRIIGITLDHGLLRTVPERKTWANPYFNTREGGVREQEEYIDLQPDGNSFDLMAGMIKAK